MPIEPSDTFPGALFSQPWWLDAVAENCWDQVVVERGGKIVARLPYAWRPNEPGVLTMPRLTQTLGPWVDCGSGKTSSRLSKHKELSQELIDGLPPFSLFVQSFHHSVENWLPWYWNGFQQTTKYTYIIDDLTDLDKTWSGFASNIKREVRKAEKQVDVHSPDSLTSFLQLNDLVFKRQGKRAPYTRQFVERLDAACKSRGQRKIFVAADSEGKLHAGCYIVWDQQSAYYLMGGGDPDLRRSGAASLCMWKAIQFSAGVSSRFDFEGSMIEPVERFFRAFGGKPIPYSTIRKSTLGPLRGLQQRVLRKIKKGFEAG